MFFVEEFSHLKIELQDAILATDNFSSDKLIGTGGFGPVYKGELSLPEGRCVVAFKRLDSKFGQGNTEFWKEILMLSKYKHENLVSLLRFCFEGDERILVYEHASRGSLDRYLSDASLTWIQRLKICVGIARGLNYLHDPKETRQRVLHRDIKSSNILLDEEWNAKVSDFGLSKVGPANQPQTYLVSNVVGTFGYCDPSYFETGLLSKESDVYSFGVVLFEVICGRLCCECQKGEMIRILVPMWRKCFDENRLDDVIFHNLKEQARHNSLMTFSTIANRCLQRDHKKRPTMVEIVQELEVAIEQQRLEDSDQMNFPVAGNSHRQSLSRTRTMEKRDDTRLHIAIRAGDIDTAMGILNGKDEQELKELLSKTNQSGETPLYVAAEYSCVDLVKEMIKYYDCQTASIVAKNGFDAFHIAAKQGDLEVLKVLMEAISELSMTMDRTNSTAFQTASAEGHIEVVKFLLEEDCNMANICRSNSKTALHYSAQKGHLEVVKALLEKVPEIATRVNKKGQTALHMAAKGQSVDIINELIAADNGLINMVDKKKNTALHTATRKGRKEIVLALLNHKEIINKEAVNNSGETALDTAERFGRPEITTVLREH